MGDRQILWLLTCSPLALVLVAWLGVLWRWRLRHQAKLALIALGIATLNAVLAATTAIRYKFQPSPLPPWKDPQTLDLASLALLAFAAIIVGLIALVYKAPWWLVAVVELSSVPLLIVGVWASSFV